MMQEIDGGTLKLALRSVVETLESFVWLCYEIKYLKAKNKGTA